jgi:glycosyl transferase family 25
MSILTVSDICHVVYINLEHRHDRKEHVERELNKLGLEGARFNAIKMENGAIGCSLSHLKILEEARKQKWDHVLIVEDDITFLNPELFRQQMNTFLARHSEEWDVVLLAGNNMPPYESVDDTCVQVKRCQTTTGYLVRGTYLDTLVSNIRTGVTHLINQPQNKTTYAIDKHWFELQQRDKWFLITPLTVVQREDYSDIEQRVMNYTALMQDLDKRGFLDKQAFLQKMKMAQRKA